MMVKRFSYSSYFYLFFALLILLVSWEHNRTLAAVLETEIPEDSIRLRILANSDSVEDQALKRRVRDAIVEQMNTWVKGPTTLEEARIIVNSHIPELEAVVDQVIQENGYRYTYKVELGIVPFPAKMYGDKVYPAGDYEALRVTIGEGAGQNWWCVLFPPLCFVDTAKGEAVAKEEPKAGQAGAGTEKAKNGSAVAQAKSGKSDSVTANAKTASVKAGAVQPAADQDSGSTSHQDGKSGIQVRFYFWEKLKSWFA